MIEQKAISWRGVDYPSISWALPDFFDVYPLASDQVAAEAFNVSPQAVQQARQRVGIPEFRQRSASNCYVNGVP